jgi:hypothetical protein
MTTYTAPSRLTSEIKSTNAGEGTIKIRYPQASYSSPVDDLNGRPETFFLGRAEDIARTKLI